MANLIEAAEAFAAILTEVVNGTVSSGARFVVTPFEGPTELAWVYPEGSTPANVSLVPIVAGLAPAEPVRLWLRTSFQVRLDDSREHLAVVRSVFALVIDEGSKRPAVRVEYDRDQGNEPDDVTPARHRRSAAHVQIHGSSEELAYVQGGRCSPGPGRRGRAMVRPRLRRAAPDAELGGSAQLWRCHRWDSRGLVRGR
jgi:hypothetical protein